MEAATQTPPLRGPAGRLAGIPVLAAGLLFACACSIAIGAHGIPLTDSFSALFGADLGQDGLRIRELRGPRTLVGLTVGASLGAAGALIQGMTRNPLADPWILGISPGAALAVVLGLFVAGVTAMSGLAWFALAGAGVAWAVVYVIGTGGRSRLAPVNLALAGAAMSAVLSALTTAVIVLDARTLDEYRMWIVGSIANTSTGTLVDLLPFAAAGMAIALLCGKSMNSLSLGDDVAASLGHRVGRERMLIAIAIVLLSGTAVALAGPIGFVGLTVPHAARALTGPDYRWVVPYSAMLGATLILLADVIGRVIAPTEIQVGIVMGVIGAPLFIALVRRRRLASL